MGSPSAALTSRSAPSLFPQQGPHSSYTLILTHNERPPAYCHQCRGGCDEEDLYSCAQCSMGRVLREDSLREECQGYLDYQINKDD